MALSIDITLESGLSAPSSYVRVTGVSLLTKTSMSACVSYFANYAASMPYQIQYFTLGYDLEGENPIAQAYLHLKTLPEFADATDC